MNKLKVSNKPAYNVLETAEWIITPEFNIDFTFDSSVMVLEFDKLREDFLKPLREAMNNFHIQVNTKLSESKEVKNHIKNRRELFADLVKENPVLDKLRIELGLDIENEP